MWEQRGHAWHGGGIGGEELGRKEEDGRHKKTQNKINTYRYVQDSSICAHETTATINALTATFKYVEYLICQMQIAN